MALGMTAWQGSAAFRDVVSKFQAALPAPTRVRQQFTGLISRRVRELYEAKVIESLQVGGHTTTNQGSCKPGSRPIVDIPLLPPPGSEPGLAYFAGCFITAAFKFYGGPSYRRRSSRSKRRKYPELVVLL